MIVTDVVIYNMIEELRRVIHAVCSDQQPEHDPVDKADYDLMFIWLTRADSDYSAMWYPKDQVGGKPMVQIRATHWSINRFLRDSTVVILGVADVAIPASSDDLENAARAILDYREVNRVMRS